jgi:hypothetical protein
MSVIADFRLPGIYFRPAARTEAASLPPLDVAAFVGFATRGPLHLPVPIADLKAYDAIFGDRLQVARDTDGNPLYAYLRGAVAAFFSNGGRRCYVVRVAGAKARAAQFRLPGLLSFDHKHGSVGVAAIEASSPGRWSAALRLGTTLASTPLPRTLSDGTPAFQVAGNLALSWTTRGAPDAVEQGDILRLSFEDGQQRLFPVDKVIRPAGDAPTATLTTQRIWSVRRTPAASLPPAITALQRLTLAGPQAISVAATFTDGPRVGLSLTGPDALAVARGDVLLFTLDDGSRHAVTVADTQAQLVGSLPQTGAVVDATEMLCVREAAGALALSPASPLTQIERLRFRLRIKDSDAGSRQLDDLRFNGGSARYWGDVAIAESGLLAGAAASGAGASGPLSNQSFDVGTATSLFEKLFGDVRADLDWNDPRLPIVLSSRLAPPSSGLDPSAAAQAPAATYLPIGMALIAADADAFGVEVGMQGDDDLAAFGPELFLDQKFTDRLAASPVAILPRTLLAAATERYFLKDKRLKGIYSLLFVDDVALVSIPDAVQRGWTSITAEAAPSLPQVTEPPAPPLDRFADCVTPPRILAIDPTSGPDSGGTMVTILGTDFAPAPDIRVTFGGRAADHIDVIDATTLRCRAPAAAVTGATMVTVGNSAGTDSLDAAFLYQPSSTQARFPTAIDVEAFESKTLWTTQLSLIRVCEARGDAVAILTLPLHFEKRECIDWLQTVRDKLGLPRHGETFSDVRDIADLSYASAYHPWIVVPDSSAPGELRPIPPDGAICGAISAREQARQVWVAPANTALPGVLGLLPPINQDDWADLFALGFNLIREEARDFRAMSAHTLADDRSLLQLSVRRMLIQLRKAALDLGRDLVFQNNDEQLRHQMRQTLESMLRSMFARGAFAGQVQQASYRVAIGDRHASADADQGRLVAQIQVAPSQPMEFITINLTRTGDGLLQTAER